MDIRKQSRLKPKLNIKQRQFVAGVVKGKSQRKAYLDAYSPANTTPEIIDANASHLIKKPQIQEVLEPLLRKHDLTLDRALKPINDALQAEQMNQYTGEVTPDHRIRLQASDRVLKLHNIGQSTTATNLVNIINLQKTEYMD